MFRLENKGKRTPFGLILALLVIVGKSSKLVAAAKVMKFGKPLVTVVSMAISAVLYGIWLGPWFGVGLVAMLFIHEMGHVIALRIKGFDTPGPVFIPFLGAAIFVPKFEDRDTEAFVGYGGPLLGMAGALACFAVWPFTTGKTAEILILVSYIGVFLNLFNLIPISPLDGGRITQPVGSWFKYLGVAILLGFSLLMMQPMVLLIWVLVLDAFNRLPLWVRPVLSTALGVAMTVLMLSGFSNQPWWLDAIDILFITTFIGRFWMVDVERSDGNDPDPADERPYPPTGIRAKWLAYYLGLTILTTAALMYQVQYLPQGVKTQSERLIGD